VIVTDLARPYSTATVHELQQAMVEDSPHLHKKVGLGDDDTRWTMRKAWEGLGREPEPWMRAEGAAAAARGEAWPRRRSAPMRLVVTRRRCSRRC